MKIKPMSPEEKLNYFLDRYNELKSIREKEKVNPSPDHKGKMKVIETELNRLSYRACLEFGKVSRKKHLEEKSKKDLTDSE